MEHPGEVDHRADIYALGVVFYQMLTGELPGKRIEPPSTKVQIDVRLDEVVLRALEKKPELRYQQVSVLKTQVETIATDMGSAAASAAPVDVSSTGTAGKAFDEMSNAAREMCALLETRFSRTAIVGAAWMPFFFAALAFVVFEPHHAFPYGFNFFASLLCFLCLSGVFATTIFGWIAVSQIRRSAGKLHGLWLAVFDGLLFPLLALDALIAVLFRVLGAAIVLDFGLPHNARLNTLLVLMVLSIVALDWWIIRRVWRAVKPSTPPDALRPPDVESWLALMDEGNYAKSWETAAPYFQRVMAKEEWVARGEKIRRPLGNVLSRKFKSSKFTAAGTQIEVKFDAAFDGLLAATETVTFAKQASGEWQPIGYLIRPARPTAWRGLIEDTGMRLLLLVAVHLVFFEVILRASASGHWRESTEESYLLALGAASLAGLVWAFWPGYRRTRSMIYLILGPVVSAVLLLAVDNFYSWQVRPALGISREVDGAAQYPAAPREPRQHPDYGAETQPVNASGSSDFGPVVETVLPAVNGRTAELLDLDTGWRVTSTTFGENDRETHAWIRDHYLDVLGVVEKGQIAVLCCDMAVLPVATNLWADVEATDIATNRALAQMEPNKITAISPTLDKTDTHFFRTREGGLGILQITGFTDNPRGVKIRYKLVQNGMAGTSAGQKPGPAGNANFAVVANPSPPLSYQWRLQETNSPAASNNPSYGPVIEKVTVQTNEAFVVGETKDGGELVLTIGNEGLSWNSELKTHRRFSAVIKPDRDELRFDVSNGSGPSLSTVENHIALAPNGRLPRGQMIFRAGTYSPASEGVVIADFQPEAGEPLPVFVSVRKANAVPSQTLSFGPVMERFIFTSPRPPYDEYSYLDLDTGRLLSLGQAQPPVDPFSAEQFYDWRRKSGADVAAQVVHDPVTVPAQFRSDFRGLVGVNTVILPVDKSAWDSMSPQAVAAAVAPVKPDTTRWTMATTLTNGLPATHLFKTSEGGIGILQILDFTDNPRGVKIRYKLVQNGTTGTSADGSTGRADSVNFAVAASGTAPLSYQWYFTPTNNAISPGTEAEPPQLRFLA